MTSRFDQEGYGARVLDFAVEALALPKSIPITLELLSDEDFDEAYERVTGVGPIRECVGFCHRNDDGSFLIIVRQSDRIPELVAFHELVHVEQAITGRLVRDGERITWDGVEFDPDLGRNVYGTFDDARNHNDRPWEVDANRRSFAILLDFVAREDLR